jgi:hypothetical protein
LSIAPGDSQAVAALRGSPEDGLAPQGDGETPLSW